MQFLSQTVTRSEYVVCIGTWNVNAKLEEEQHLPLWLKFDIEPDIIAVGIQEMIELSAANIIVGSTVADLASERAGKWIELIQKYLNDSLINKKYELIDAEYMIGLNLMVFATSEVKQGINESNQTSVIPCGAVGILGNKGAVCVSLQLDSSYICFVNAHFAAHQDELNKRNEDYAHIISAKVFTTIDIDYSQNNYMNETVLKTHKNIRKSLSKIRKRVESVQKDMRATSSISLANTSTGSEEYTSRGINHEEIYTGNRNRILSNNSTDYLDEGTTTSAASSTSSTNKVTKYAVNDHDIIIWFGDLNYRLEPGLSLLETYECIYDKTFAYLQTTDQLLYEKAAGRIFTGFHEAPLSFPPTYKFIPDKDQYDDRPDGKLRFPAWCDRVLWRTRLSSSQTSSNVIHVNQILYDTHPVTSLVYRSGSNIMSDHRPVQAILKILTNNVDDELQECALQQRGRHILKAAAMNKLIFYPDCLDLSVHSLKGDVLLRSLFGEYTVRFAFAESNIPSWMRVRPQTGVIGPSEELEVTLDIDARTLMSCMVGGQREVCAVLCCHVTHIVNPKAWRGGTSTSTTSSIKEIPIGNSLTSTRRNICIPSTSITSSTSFLPITLHFGEWKQNNTSSISSGLSSKLVNKYI